MSTKTVNYTPTRLACYLAIIVQAAVINLVPILYTSFKEIYGLSYVSLASLLSLNFVVQLSVDIIFSKSADKYGFRPFIVSSTILITAGFLLFAATPKIFGNVYVGFVISTVLYSVGGGLMEILISPIIDSIPSKSKTASMAILHSMYAWGMVIVLILSTVFIYFFKNNNWQILIALWAILPFITFLLFAFSPIPKIESDEQIGGMRKVIFQPLFIICILIIFFGAGAENTMSQWSSAFVEKIMVMPKILSDFGGMLTFSVAMGMGRLLHGVFSKKLNLPKLMLYGSVISFFCYLLASFSFSKPLVFGACALTGFCVSMLWPGTLVLAKKAYPASGAWLFAILATSGDCGAAFCPWLAGLISDNAYKFSAFSSFAAEKALNNEQLGLRIGMAFSSIYAVCTAVCIVLYMRKKAATTFSE